MLKIIEYKITLPFNTVFSKSPKFLLIKEIYKKIKRSSCIIDSLCKDCDKKDSCIYYFLSGENFNHSEGICVEMGPFEKTVFLAKDSFNVKFYLLGTATIYESFITEYFKHTEYLEGNYFQKKLIQENEIDIKLLTGKYEILIQDSYFNYQDELIYLYNKYNLEIDLNGKINIIESKPITDYNKYYINGRSLKYRGFKGIIELENIPSFILNIGMGNRMIISGGKISEN